MSRCIQGREVVVRLRKRATRKAEEYRVVCPARWTKADLLRYTRAEHPDSSAVIVTWNPSVEADGWTPRLWIANPAGFSDYPRAFVSKEERDRRRRREEEQKGYRWGIAP